MAEVASTAPQPAKNVIYCGVCSLPPEYCEFGGKKQSPSPTSPTKLISQLLSTGTTKKCSDWLSENHPDLHSTLYSDAALSANLSTLSVDAQKRAEKDAIKKAAKAEAAEARESEKRAASKIIIKRVERNKRKYVTEISGLEAFGLDLKATAKAFGKKFATGSSVTKTASGGEEITVQGDVSDDVVDWLNEHHEGIPEDNIECIEDKKKKAAPTV